MFAVTFFSVTLVLAGALIARRSLSAKLLRRAR
jgi:hypothetical protein